MKRKIIFDCFYSPILILPWVVSPLPKEVVVPKRNKERKRILNTEDSCTQKTWVVSTGFGRECVFLGARVEGRRLSHYWSSLYSPLGYCFTCVRVSRCNCCVRDYTSGTWSRREKQRIPIVMHLTPREEHGQQVLWDLKVEDSSWGYPVKMRCILHF